MKTIITMKSILRKVIVLTGFYSLFIFPASSANLSNPDEGWISSSGEKTVLDQAQADRKPFGEDDAPQAQLRAAPGGGGTPQKNEVPVSEGIWVIAGLAIAYGVVRRKSKKDTL